MSQTLTENRENTISMRNCYSSDSISLFKSIVAPLGKEHVEETPRETFDLLQKAQAAVARAKSKIQPTMHRVIKEVLKKKDEHLVSQSASAKFCFPSKFACQLTEFNRVQIKDLNGISADVKGRLKNAGGVYDKDERIWNISINGYKTFVTSIDDPLFKVVFTPVPNIALLCLEPLNTMTFSMHKRQITLDYSSEEPVKEAINRLPVSFKNKLFPFQAQGIAFGIEKKGRILLADEMGIGKTIQAIGIAYIYRSNWPLLIICPASLKLNWRKEILQWLPEIKDEAIQVLSSSKEDLLKQSEIIIVSYDLLTRINHILSDYKFDMIIADEAHYIKSETAKRSKALLPCLKTSKRVLLLSGTPILARPAEVFNLLNGLRPDIFDDFYPYGERYCKPKLR